MVTLTEGSAIGDVVLFEEPMAYARDEYEIVRDLLATAGIEAGTVLENSIATATAAVQTITMATASASGTFRLSFRGVWTAPIAWNATAGTIKTAFELISGGVIVTFSAAFTDAATITFANTVGNIPEVKYDPRLNLTAAADPAVATIATTTVGELADHAEPCVTGAQAFAILLEAVSLTDRVNASGESLRRAVLVRGPSIINSTAMVLDAGATRADAVTALEALGIQTRTEPTVTVEGTPTG